METQTSSCIDSDDLETEFDQTVVLIMKYNEFQFSEITKSQCNKILYESLKCRPQEDAACMFRRSPARPWRSRAQNGLRILTSNDLFF